MAGAGIIFQGVVSGSPMLSTRQTLTCDVGQSGLTFVNQPVSRRLALR